VESEGSAGSSHRHAHRSVDLGPTQVKAPAGVEAWQGYVSVLPPCTPEPDGRLVMNLDFIVGVKTVKHMTIENGIARYEFSDGTTHKVKEEKS